MGRLLTLSLILFVLILASSALGAGLTFTFANGTISGSSPSYYEFDVMVQASVSGTRIGDALVYINYNTLGFGIRVVDSSRVTVTKGVLIEGELIPGTGLFLYDIVNIIDNSDSRFAVGIGYNFDSSPGFGNEVPTAPTNLLHVSMEIIDPSETSGLSFEQSLMVGQQFESDNIAIYDPIVASDLDDTSLPVQLLSYEANSIDNKVYLKWITESEINNAGFEVWRSSEEAGDYVLLSSYQYNETLRGQGNSSTRHEYLYRDELVVQGQSYWYKLVDVALNGERAEHGPINVEVLLGDDKLTSVSSDIPTAYKLHQNYPNPFNPSTRIRFDIPRVREGQLEASLVIYNSLGQVVRKLYRGEIGAGSFEVEWDGRSDSGNQIPSGIYFATFAAKNYFQTIRLILLK